VSVADLILAGDEPKSPVQIVAPDEVRILWNGPNGGSAVLLVGSDGPAMLELWRWILQPGERYQARPHSSVSGDLITV
jgi:hypothetical protein